MATQRMWRGGQNYQNQFPANQNYGGGGGGGDRRSSYNHHRVGGGGATPSGGYNQNDYMRNNGGGGGGGAPARKDRYFSSGGATGNPNMMRSDHRRFDDKSMGSGVSSNRFYIGGSGSTNNNNSNAAASSSSSSSHRDSHHHHQQDSSHHTSGGSDRNSSPHNSNHHNNSHHHQQHQQQQRQQSSNSIFYTQRRAFRSNYEIRPPRYASDIKHISPNYLYNRFTRLYVPSDFFHATFHFQDAFPLGKQFPVGNPCQIHILSEEVEMPAMFPERFEEPKDSNPAWQAKVMLLSGCPDFAQLFHRCCTLAEETTTELSSPSKASITKVIQFLCGSKGRGDPMAIGGNWSPSLDGPNPDSDPQVLINTAIRTCRGMLGIDLSKCTEWIKFVEFYYQRADSASATTSTANTNTNTTAPTADQHSETAAAATLGGDTTSGDSEDPEKQTSAAANAESTTSTACIQPGVERVVIFLPNIWATHMPSSEEWEKIKEVFEAKLTSLINPTESSDANTANVNANANANTNTNSETTNTQSSSEDATQNAAQKDVPETTASTADSTTSTSESAAATTVSKISEKEKRRFEKMYRLPEKPCILVRPDGSAFEYRFQSMHNSLSQLLDYRHDSQKEYTFEVSLFAEGLLQLIQRQSVYTIYQNLVALTPSSPSTCNSESISTSATEEHYSSSFSLSLPSDPKKPRHDLEHVARLRKNRRTVNKWLLLAFSIWDWDHADYIKETDLFEILQFLRLEITGKQLQALIARVPLAPSSSSSSNAISKNLLYRELTDQDCNIDNLAATNGDVCFNNWEKSLGDEHIANRAELEKFHCFASKDAGDVENIHQIHQEINQFSQRKLKAKLRLDEIKHEYEKSAVEIEVMKNGHSELTSKIQILKKELDESRVRFADYEKFNDAYRSLLKSVQENMKGASDKIQSQFDAEKKEKEEKEKEEEEKRKAKEAAEEAEAIEKARIEQEQKAAEEREMDTNDTTADSKDDVDEQS